MMKLRSIFRSKSTRLFSTSGAQAPPPTLTTAGTSTPPSPHVRLRPTIPPRKMVQVGALTRINYDLRQYIVNLDGDALAFESGKSLLDFYIHFLAQVLGSEEEAKKRIYFVSPVWYQLSFGAYIDEETVTTLSDLPNVRMVTEDFYAEAREKSPIAKSMSEFVPYNWGQRLFNLNDYYLSSKGNNNGDPGQWIIQIIANSGIPNHEIVDYYINLLSQVINSVKEAKERIYLIWTIEPFGFAAEMDEATAKKLKGIYGVENVLPDYDEIVKNIDDGGLIVSSPLSENSDPIISYLDLSYDEEEEFRDSTNETSLPEYIPESYFKNLPA